jgi:epsilon-lactone hydrolase
VPSALHRLYAAAIPRLFDSGELVDADAERAAVRERQRERPGGLPTWAVPGFRRRYLVETQDAGGFPAYVITPRRGPVHRTIVLMHGGAYVAPIDALHVRYGLALGRRLRARLVVPDYPLAPEHSWRDSHEQLVDLTARWSAEPGGAVLVGDSAGGGLALAVAQSLRDRGGAQPSRLVLLSPWSDLTMSAPGTEEYDRRDPWLFLSKAHAYARFWAGDDDVARREVSPALGDLAGLPPALLVYGGGELLTPTCRMLAHRATESGWRLTAVEEPGALHVYSLMPGLPEGRRAFRRTVEFCR